MHAEINGVAIEPERDYSMVSTLFIRQGGDGYSSLKEGTSLSHARSGELLENLLKEYLAEHSEVAPKLDGRITFETSRPKIEQQQE
jgi:hypothetical protein